MQWSETEKDDRLLLHQTRTIRQTKGEKNSQTQAKKEAIQTKGANPSCRFGHPPVCQNYKSETGCIHGRKCFFRHVEAEGKPNIKSKKGSAKGSVANMEESTRLGCLSQDSYPRKSILREKGKLGSKHAVKFSEGTWHQKIGKETVHRQYYPKLCAS